MNDKTTHMLHCCNSNLPIFYNLIPINLLLLDAFTPANANDDDSDGNDNDDWLQFDNLKPCFMTVQ